MREPLKTRLILLAGAGLIIAAGACILFAILQVGWNPLAIMAISAAPMFAFASVFFISRAEYGEWLKGEPWWERMRKDGYRPPFKVPPP